MDSQAAQFRLAQAAHGGWLRDWRASATRALLFRKGMDEWGMVFSGKRM
jgi:hypothetical protein